MHVFINPGHSLYCSPDAGCCYNGLKEAEVVAEVGSRLKELLELHGIKTTLYQQKGDMSSNEQLRTVATKANESGADLFLSIHLNGVTNQTAKGTETWYYEGSTNGKKFAEYINSKLIKPFTNYQLTNRGTKQTTSLYVLKHTKMTSALVELGFISNLNESVFISTNKQNLAIRLCEAIKDYYGIHEEPKLAKPKCNTIKLDKNDDGTFNCYIDGILKLNHNRFTTCVDWLRENYGI